MKGRVSTMNFGHVVRISAGGGSATSSFDTFSRVFTLRDQRYWDYPNPTTDTFPWMASDDGRLLLCESSVLTRLRTSRSRSAQPAKKHSTTEARGELRIVDRSRQLRARLSLFRELRNATYLDTTHTVTDATLSPDGHTMLLTVEDIRQHRTSLRWYVW